MIRDNLHKWGAQWVSELDVLGVPLYVSDDAERFWRIEDYVSNFSEIAFVRFYANDGRVLFADSPGTPANPPAPLDTAAFDRLAALSPGTPVNE